MQYDYYYLGVIGRDGMYCSGERAATPELARIARGNLIPRKNDRLGVYGVRRLPGFWSDSAGNRHERCSKPVLVELVD